MKYLIKLNEDLPTPVTGLIFIGILILYFLYLAIVQACSIFLTVREDE